MITNKLGLFLLALALAPLRLAAAPGCDAKDYAGFVADAQALNPAAEAPGRALLKCGNRDIRESSYFWLGFYYGMKDQKPQLVELRRLLPIETDSSPRARLQSQALRGDPAGLNDAVSAGRSSYVDDPWLLLSLARAQANLESFPASFAAYERLLKLKDDQDAAEIELLFAYIWAQDYAAAGSKASALRRYTLSPYMRQSLERADKHIAEEEARRRKPHDHLSLAYVQQRDNRGYGALGGKLLYEGWLEFELEALEEEHPLEHAKETTLDVLLAKHWGHHDGLQLKLGAGYFSAGEDHVTGLAKVESPLGAATQGFVALSRRPVSIVEKPTVGERAGIMRDSATWGLNWNDHFFLQGGLHQDHADALFEDYKAEIRLGASLEDPHTSGFGFVIPISYRHQPTPSPDYRSFPRDARAGLGVRLGLSDGHRYSLRTQAVIESIHRTDYGAVSSYARLLGGRISAEARYHFQKNYYSFCEGNAYLIEKMPGERDDERGSEFLVGIGITQVAH